MTVFADSSAIVKLYVPERDCEQVRALRRPLVVSAVALAEVPAALWRKHRMGDVTAADAALLAAAFQHDAIRLTGTATKFTLIAASSTLLAHAGQLVSTHDLRGYDAVQLASALAARGADPECDTVAVFDVRLRAAAGAEGFHLLPSASAPTPPAR